MVVKWRGCRFPGREAASVSMSCAVDLLGFGEYFAVDFDREALV